MSSALNIDLASDARAIELIKAFVNTYDVETGEEALADAAVAARWLRDRAGIPPGGPLAAAELARVLELREALRGLLLANNGVAVDPAQTAPLREARTRARLEAAIDASGAVSVALSASGVEAFEAALLLAIATAQAHGSWQRLKACPADDCHWAFYDESRNRSRTWCSMEVCGNRQKTRAYRRRRGRARA